MLPVTRNGHTSTPIPWAPVNRLDALFGRLLDDAPMVRERPVLPVAMWQDEDHIYIEVELPGVAEPDVELTVHNGVLFIRADRKPEQGRRYLYNDRSYGRFERAVTLPEDVIADEVQAELKGGVLSIALPKRPEARPKKITIKAG
jgi:HSP20 family protein